MPPRAKWKLRHHALKMRQLRSFLGLVNYYRKFIAHLSSLLQPLNSLLQKVSQVLTHYDPELPMKIAADATAYGVGAVISHVLPDGSERPLAFT